MKNTLTKGSELLPVMGDTEKSTEDVIINEDWCMVAVIISYDASIGRVTLSKIWDLAGTKKQFYAWAKYPGTSGIPAAHEVEVGAHVPVYRTGETNIQFGTVPEVFELHGPANYSKASFVCFFFS